MSRHSVSHAQPSLIYATNFRSGTLDAIAMVLDEPRARGELIPEPGWALVESVEIPA